MSPDQRCKVNAPDNEGLTDALAAAGTANVLGKTKGVVSVTSETPVRLATSRTSGRDRAQIRVLTQAVHEKSLFGDILFSEAKFDRAFDKTLDAPEQHLGLVVMLGARVLGCCYCSIGGYFIGDGGRIVSVNTICVDPEVSGGLLGGKVALSMKNGICEVSFSWFFAGGTGAEGAPHGCKLAHIS